MRRENSRIGRVQKNARGFAFIVPCEPGFPDTYVSPEDARTLLNRDRVKYAVVRDGRREKAKIIRILERGITHVYGQYCDTPKPHVLSPGGEVLDCKRTELARGMWVVAKIENYPTESRPAVVRVTETLGPTLLPSHDVRVTTVTFGLPMVFSEAAITLAHRQWEEELPRRDQRSLPFVTIDGADAKDFDDAVFVEAQSGEIAFILYVAIADVSHYVRPGTPLDEAAHERSTSVYFPGECIPMLPEILSNDRCSLRPDEDKRVLVAELHYDRDADLVDSRFYAADIRTHSRLTYAEVQQFFDGHKRLGALEVPLKHARALFRKLLRHRASRHTLEFALPEAAITVDNRGNPTEIRPASVWESHKLIEEFMIAANSAVAAKLKRSPTLFRVHEPPSADKLTQLNAYLRAVGVSRRLEQLSQREISELLKIDNRSLHLVILRLQKQARYAFEPLGHFGLSLSDYLHFTSPIRRYPDLMVHRALKRVLGGLMGTPQKTDEDDWGSDIATETSDKERRAMEAERFITRRKFCWFALPSLGKDYSATVTNLVRDGVFVELENLIDGFCPLPFCEFDEKRTVIQVGGIRLRMGDTVDVKLVRVDVESGHIEFSLL